MHLLRDILGAVGEVLHVLYDAVLVVFWTLF
jgi:hypothetical protein